MNRIILIGNGFDLAHGMKTSYGDFMDWFWMHKATEIQNRIHKYEYFQLTNIGGDENNIKLDFTNCKNYSDIINVIKSQRVAINFKNKFLEQITEKQYIQNWVDIENEYYQLLKDIMTEKEKFYSISELNSDFEKIKNELEKYLTEEQNKFDRTRHEDLIISISHKIYSSFQPRDFVQQAMDSISQTNYPQEILLLNFNYTRTEIFYQNYYYKNPKTYTNIIHIHGSLSLNDKNPIIFGYGDELDEEYKKIENLNNNEYLENIKSIKYLETDNYKRLLEIVNSDEYQIFIFGHSCGNSDRTLLNTLFEHENCVSIKPFYYLKKDGTDNYSDMVRNISRNFNNKAIMRDKVVNKKYCETLA